MQWYVYLMTASAAVVFSWSSLVLFGRPVRLLFDLRRDVLAHLFLLGSIAVPSPRDTAVTSRQIREYDEAVRKLREAEQVFRDLGSRLLAFRESESMLCAMLRLFGLDLLAAGDRLNDLAATCSQPADKRAGLCHDIEDALRAATPARRRHSHSNHLLDYQHRFLRLDDVGLMV